MSVHIDNYSAQTGVSRFLELNRDSGWIYDKTENLHANSSELMVFTHLLVEADSEKDPRMLPFKSTHEILDFVTGFSGIEYYNGLATGVFSQIPNIKIRLSPKIFILKKLA